ncbi:MAG TPA: hypothetical protein PKD26_05425 [Pyrinomonadaceae bacterium]|nr:hypothetical protein [Pyrinomonadaceae bacterium]
MIWDFHYKLSEKIAAAIREILMLHTQTYAGESISGTGQIGYS